MSYGHSRLRQPTRSAGDPLCAVELPAALAEAGIRRTAVIFVGRVLDPHTHPGVTDSYLYSHARMGKLRSDPGSVQ